MTGRHHRHLAVKVPHYVALIVIGVLALFPMYFMAVSGLKNGIQLEENPFGVAIAHPFGTFYATAWDYVDGDMLRTVLIIAASVAGILVLGMLSAYAFARMEFLGSGFLFYVIFGLLLIPSFLTLIPLFLEVKGMGLLDNPLALILPYIAGGQAFAIFVFRSSIRGIPEELFEAARVDGASHLRMLVRIAAPLSRPIMIAVGLLNVTAFWGDYVFPSLVLSVPPVDSSHGYRQLPASTFCSEYQCSQYAIRGLHDCLRTDNPTIYNLSSLLYLWNGNRRREDVSPLVITECK